MKNADYWKQRFTQLEAAQHSIGASALPDIEQIYLDAEKELEGKIAVWYQRFANNNGISMSDARQYLTGANLKEFKWSVQEYIQYGKENALTGQWMQELENASAKYHISKLEALKLHTKASLQKLYDQQLGITSSTLQKSLESGYYHTAYELQKGFNVGWDITGLDQTQIEQLLVKPWATDGYNFSDRIWNNKEKLITQIHHDLTQGVMLGQDPQKTINSIAKKMGTSKYNAGRLVMTEEAYFSSVAQQKCFEDLGVEQYEIVATLDSHTSAICRSLDGKVFQMKDYEAGVTAPPFHVYCRTTTAPHFDENFGQIGERAARDEETGETYYIPDDMKYQEWEDTFVNGGDKSGFDVVSNPLSGATSYKHHVEPESPKPKKQYLTKKKLQANIAQADADIEDLEKAFETQTNGLISFEDFKLNYQGDYSQIAYDASEEAALKSIGDQIEQLEQQKADWQAKLDVKLKAEKKKQLTKQQMALETQKADVEQQLNDFDIKTYSGIWMHDVTTADAAHLNIAGKKAYYEGKLLTETDPALKQKFQDLYDQLLELETEGQSYNQVQQELHKIESELSKIQADLTTLENGGTLTKTVDDAFTQERKDAALWAKTTKAADDRLRDVSGQVWKNASHAERHGLYDYTAGSGKFNRPLSGFEKPWAEYGSGWEPKYFKGKNKVWIDFEGAGDEIRAMTDAISRSSYDFDVWLQRGCDGNALESFLGLPPNTFEHMSEAELQNFIGRSERMYAFTSCGVCKGKGFSSKPIIINMYCPKGTNMIYAEPFSCFGQGDGQHWDGVSKQKSFGSEAEMIIQRGASYTITKIEKSNGRIYIDMEVHPEQGYDLFQQDPNEWTGSKKNYKS